MIDKTSLEYGDIVQVSSEHPVCGGCFLMVEKTGSKGVQGFIAIPHPEKFVRFKIEIPWTQFEYCGYAIWTPSERPLHLQVYEKCEHLEFKMNASM